MARFSRQGKVRTIPSTLRLMVEALEDRTLPAIFNPLVAAGDSTVNPDSLRAAIIVANSNGESDTFKLEAGTYQLSISGRGENFCATGDLDLTELNTTYTFQGAGMGVTFVDAGLIDRVIQMFPGVTAVFRDLTIQHGLARDSVTGTSEVQGGGIASVGQLTLEHVRVQDNQALGSTLQDGAGGGIASFGGTLTIGNSQIVNNVAEGAAGVSSGGLGQDARGGGIRADNSLVVIVGTMIASNQANAGAGGAGSAGGNGGGGGVAFAGGIYAFSSQLIISQSTISGNTASGGDGGTGADGNSADGGRGGYGSDAIAAGIFFFTGIQFELTNSLIVANVATGGTGGTGGKGGAGAIAMAGFAGGAGGNGGPGAIGGLRVHSSSPAVIIGCTFSGNQAKAGRGGAGGAGGQGGSVAGVGIIGGTGGQGGSSGFTSAGAIRVASGSALTMTNTTLSANVADGGVGGMGGAGGLGGTGMFPGPPGNGGDGGHGFEGRGGAIFIDGTLNLNNSTIAFNQANGGLGGAAGGSGGSAGGASGGIGGGVYNSANLNAISSIIAKDLAASGPDVYNDSSGSFSTAQNNLIGIGSSSGLGSANPDINGNRVGSTSFPIDPLLLPMAFNGGPTQTHALDAGSPAIGNGSNPLGLTADQRGFVSRANGAAADIGAFETDARAPALFAVGVDGLVPAGVKQLKVFNGDGSLRFQKDLYARSTARGVRVAVGDLTDDGFPDIVTGPGRGVTARVFLIDGMTGVKVRNFPVYGAGFKKGIFVAVGDVLDDAGNEIVVAPADNSREVAIFSSAGQMLASFRAYDPGYKGAVHIAVVDDLVLATRGGTSRQVRAFTGVGQLLTSTDFAQARGSPFIAAGDVNQDGENEIILGDAPRTGPNARVFERFGALQRTIDDPFGPGFLGSSVRVGLIDLNNDGKPSIVLAPGRGGGRKVKIFDGVTGTQLPGFIAFATNFKNGMFVAGSS